MNNHKNESRRALVFPSIYKLTKWDVWCVIILGTLKGIVFYG